MNEPYQPYESGWVLDYYRETKLREKDALRLTAKARAEREAAFFLKLTRISGTALCLLIGALILGPFIWWFGHLYGSMREAHRRSNEVTRQLEATMRELDSSQEHLKAIIEDTNRSIEALP